MLQALPSSDLLEIDQQHDFFLLYLSCFLIWPELVLLYFEYLLQVSRLMIVHNNKMLIKLFFWGPYLQNISSNIF